MQFRRAFTFTAFLLLLPSVQCVYLVTTADAASTPFGFRSLGSSAVWIGGMSADGKVIVGDKWGDGVEEAFRWTEATGIVGIGDLPEGGFYSHPAGISADGLVIVGTAEPDPSSGGRQAFRWTQATGMVGLGYLGPSNSSSQSAAQHTSGDGSVVIGYSLGSGPTPSQTWFRWTEATGMEAFGAPFGVVTGLSADGRTVTGTKDGQSYHWNQSTGFTTIGYDGSFFPTGISADGSAVFGRAGIEAFRWTAGTGVVRLGLPTGAYHSAATAASANGSIVIGESISDTDPMYRQETFLWNESLGIVDVRQLLEANHVPGVESWILSEPTAVSADGRTIAGGGFNLLGLAANEFREAWVATTSSADVNTDWTVNIFDLNLVSARWGESGPIADANGDGIVNIFDVNDISSNWTESEASATRTPEPGSFVLAAFALAGGFLSIRRRTGARIA